MGAKTAIELLKALATRVGGKEVKNVFRQNLDDTFGKDEVNEGIRIITDREKSPYLSKMFFRENESLEDDLVNLLETRYAGSERLQYHPFSFNRRGPGAADRYKKINDSGMRLTDLPGGPADKNLYASRFGEMSGTEFSGKPVYKNKRPTILDEVTEIADEGQTIDASPVTGRSASVQRKMDAMLDPKLAEDSLYKTSIADMPLINRLMKETGKSETEIREAIVDMANEGYESGSAKLMKMNDDDMLRAYVSNRQAVPREAEMFVDDMMERLGFGPTAQTGDDIVRNMQAMEREIRALKEITEAEQQEVGQAMDAFRRLLEDGEEPSEALKFLKAATKRTKQAKGGRVGMFLGGAATGIMQAIKLANKGIRPFGQKQTYKQNVKSLGLSSEQFDKVFKKQLDGVPDEVVDDATGRGLKFSLDEAEDIITGVKFGLLTRAQRTKIAQAMRDKVARQIYDDPNPRLSNDYFEYMDNAIDRMDRILEIERLGGDLTPKPVKGAPEFIQIDFTQFDKLKNKAKNVDNVIPFKPREKKYTGGLAGIRALLRKLGMDAPDKIADKKQIKSVIRDPETDLERRYVTSSAGTPPTPKDKMTIDEIRQMIMDDPRYDGLTKKQMDEVVVRETTRVDFAYNMGVSPDEVGDDIVDMLLAEGYDKRFMVHEGGIADTVASAPQQQSPYVQQVQRANQAAMSDPIRQQFMKDYMSSPAFKEAQERSQQFQLRQNEANQAMRMQMMGAEQGLADTYAGMEDFQQVGLGLDKRIENLGRGLMQGQQQIVQAIKANPNQSQMSPFQTGLQSQSVLNLGGLGNLFGIRS